MELIERYLQAVRSYLPERQKDDIVKELSENIQSQVEDREAELGRKLEEEEVAAILRQHGHPMAVAGRYLPRQYLIGPAVFPYYWFTVTRTVPVIAMTLFAIGAGLVPLMRNALDTSHGKEMTLRFGPPGEAVAWFFGGMIAWLAAVTVIFAVLETYQSKVRLLERWNPQTLPPLARDTDVRPRSKAIASIVASSLLLPLWLAAPHYPFVVLGPGARWIEFTAGSQLGFLLISVLVLAQITRDILSLARPHWTRFEAAARVMINGASAGVLLMLARIGDWVAPVAGAPEGIVRVTRTVNVACGAAFAVATGVAAGLFVWACWQYGRKWMGRQRSWVAGVV